MLGAWIILLIAIVVEIAATALLPKAAGFTHPWWSAVVLGGYGVSSWLLAVVVRNMPVSMAYAVWSGLGTAAVAVVGYWWLGESMSWLKVSSIAMIVLGVVGLNLVAPH